MLKELLQDQFGLEVKIEDYKISGLPIYLKSRRCFYAATMGNYTFLVVSISPRDKFGAIALQNQIAIYREKTNLQTALYFNGLTKHQRDALIKHKIPFISSSGQLYLPFLGIVLNNIFSKEGSLPSKKMMPATQLLFLYLLYSNNDYVVKKDAAEKLQLTRTSITRASAQLMDMGLIKEEKHGKEIHMITTAKGKELYEKAKEFLISPVQKKMSISDTAETSDLLVAGESALSNKSMLAAPKYRTYAVYKGDECIKLFKEIDTRWDDSEHIEVELWKYDPKLLSTGREVDGVSMALSLSDVTDERVQGELEEYLEDYTW